MSGFLYGAGYYPLMHSREEWQQDLDHIQKCHINIIRTAELFNTWDQIEPVQGQFEFGFLDDFFDECAARGLKILLGTGTASPPYWLHELDPEVNILSAGGSQYPNNVSYSWACFHNPTYRQCSERYLRTLVQRYKNHPALYAYQIHNEIGLPFMSVSGKEIEMYCYCRHSKSEFRQWLQKKYENLDALNRAWTWSATNIRHTSWEQVEPPYAKPTSWSSVTRYLDFRLFMMDTITDFVSWQNGIIKQMDLQHPTSTNIFYMKGEDKMSVMTAIDQFSLAKVVDIIGYDLYPGSGNKLETRPEFSSMFLDHAASVSRPLGKPYWLLEVESGPINGWAMGPHRNTSPQDIHRYIMEAVGHDSKFTLYQGFRQWDFQPLNWGGLVDLDGQWTPRCDAAQKAGEFVTRNSDFLVKAQKPKGQVALLVSRENAIIANGMGHEQELVQAISASYKTFWELGYDVDFISPELLENGYANDYAVIATPFLLSVSQDMARALHGYAQQGGIVVGMPRLSYVDQQGWYNHQTPTGGLGALFGVQTQCVEMNQGPALTYGRRDYIGCAHKETLAVVGEETTIIARFFDDTPAITVNPLGRGMGLYFATHADMATLANGSTLLQDVLADVLSQRGIVPTINVRYSNRLNREIDCHLLRGPDRDLAIITVFCKKDRAPLFVDGKKLVDVELLCPRKPKSIVKDGSVEGVDFSYSGELVKFPLTILQGENPCYWINY